MADYTLPGDVEKRLRYFDGQFLKDQDFIDDQHYFLDRQRRHSRFLNVAGIVDGLEVTPGLAQVTVAAGTALDSQGRQIVLGHDRPVRARLVPLDAYKGKTVHLVIAYQQKESDQAQVEAGGAGATRFWEDPYLGPDDKLPSDIATADRIILARLTIDANGAVTRDDTVRVYAGVRLPDGTGTGQGPTLRAGTTSRLDLTGALSVTGNVGIGTADPKANLEVAGAGSGHTGQVSLQLRNGNSANYYASGSSQITFGYNNTAEYRHAIRTRHHGGQQAGNAIDFYVWKHDQNPDKAAIAGLHTMTLNGGNVGIGTTDPGTFKLKVEGGATSLGGTLTVTNTTTLQDTLTVTKATTLQDTLTVTKATTLQDTLTVTKATTLQDTLSVTKNVSIGKTDSEAQLDVAGDIQANTVSLARDNNKRGALFLALKGNFGHALYNNYSNRDNEGAWDGVKWNVGAGLHIRVGSSKSSALYIAAGGNVGIGVPDPQANLEVAGSANTASQVSLQLRSGNDATRYESTQIAFGYSNTAEYRHAIKTRHHSGQQAGNAIDFYVWKYDKDNSDKTTIAGLHTMTLNGGNVGIGTTDPGTFKLKVEGGATSLGGTLTVTNTTTLQDTLTVTKATTLQDTLTVTKATTLQDTLSVTKNVSIGKTDSEAQLNVAGDIQANTVSLARDNNKRGALFLALKGDFNHALYNNNSNRDNEGAWDGVKWNVFSGLNIRVGGWTSKSSALYIASGGNVGIGTSTPGAKLDVRGSIKLGEDGDLFATAGVDNLRILCGTVNSGGSNVTSTKGFSVTKPGTGLYDIAFSPPFANTPAVVVTQQHSSGGALNDFSDTGGDTRDNCVVVAAIPSRVRVKCGDNGGQEQARQFAFIAIGLR